MKSHVIVSVFVGSSLLAGATPVPAAPVQVAAVPEQAVSHDSPVVAALQKITASLARMVPMLSIIKDKPSAELHAFDVGNLFIDYEACWAEYAAATAGMKDADLLRLAPNEYQRYEFLNRRFRFQCRRLSWAGHYDCLDLRTAMGEEVKEHETEPEKERPLLPEPQVQQLAASVAKAQALYLSRNRNVQGGPGFTRETAWIMLDPKMSVIAQEYEIMKEVIRETADRQSLVYEGERWYDLLEYDVKVDGVTYTVDQWFDITLHADTMSARAQAAAARQSATEAAVPPATRGEPVPAAADAAPVVPPVVTSSATTVAPPVAPAAAPAAATPVAAPLTEPTTPARKTKRSRSTDADAPAAPLAPAPAAQPAASPSQDAPATIKQTDLIIST
ncbi:MAG: hypothetical protein IJ985_00045 [Akkermansia sp.]|nr:hypothetical protein [Akkermansia sp.]